MVLKKLLIVLIGIMAYNISNAQCIFESETGGWTVELELNIVEVIYSQDENSSSCEVNLVIEYDAVFEGIGSLWTFQGTSNCADADGTGFFNLPNSGGNGEVTTQQFSFSEPNCEDIVLDCAFTIEVNGPGLNTTMECGLATTLPVTLASFDYTMNQRDLVLNWETSEEINTELYEVLSSDDLREWKVEGQVSAEGNTNHLSSYSYKLDSPTTQKYYKLNIKDFDGYEAYSKVLHISPYRGSDARINIFPNPTFDYLEWQDDIVVDELEILSIVGNSIYKNSNQRTNRIDLSDLKPGTYFAVFTQGDTIQRKQFIKY